MNTDDSHLDTYAPVSCATEEKENLNRGLSIQLMLYRERNEPNMLYSQFIIHCPKKKDNKNIIF